MNAPLRKTAPYIFYGQTTSLCETCHALVPAKIIIEGSDVFYLKRCQRHGVQKTIVSTDAAYFKLCRDYIKPGDRPMVFQSRTEFGCPYDCCPDHEQHSCLALIDVNEACNLTCPVCFAVSSTAKTYHRPLAEIERMLDGLVASEGEPDLLQISGGEPTIHSQILDIIRAAKARPIRHIMLNTNGIRIAEEPEFVDALAEFKPGFEVYLQFDSLRAAALRTLRGADLTRIRRQALEALEERNISTTLVVVVKRGVNEDEIGEIIDFALDWKCVRGITFQPIQDAGRNLDFDKNRDRVVLSDIRRKIIEAGTRCATAATSRRSPRSFPRTSWSRRCRTRLRSRNIRSCTSRCSSSSRSPPPSATRPSGWRRCSAACHQSRCRKALATTTSSDWRWSSSLTPTTSASAASSARASIS